MATAALVWMVTWPPAGGSVVAAVSVVHDFGRARCRCEMDEGKKNCETKNGPTSTAYVHQLSASVECINR